MLEGSISLYKKSLILLSTYLFVSIYCEDDCWLKFNTKQHFDEMDEIDERYAEVRQNFQAAVGGNKFDKDMLIVMIKTRGIAERALHRAEGDQSQIPAGINLGGSCMLRVPQAILFFHRMKLRNNTRFRVVDLESNLTTLELRANLLLNDLHLFGSYDISHIKQDSSQLLYYPSFGEVELLLKNVSYKVDGHYRLLHNRLNLEHVRSHISMDGILMMYNDRKNSSNSFSMETKNIETFIDRLQVDLNKWIKDYFNDYLAYFVVAKDTEFEKYNQEKTTALNNYADKVIDIVKEKLDKIQAHAVQLPTFTIRTQTGADIRLRDGVLRGLDSIHRRSIATGSRQDNIRHVDAIVGFSNLKLQYRYYTIAKDRSPPVTGVLTLAADDLTALMELEMVQEPETSDISFKFVEQTKPESLTVEGSANRLISNFKYILERHVIAIMTNSLMHNINMLGTLDRCVPMLMAFKEAAEKNTDIDYSLENKDDLKEEETEKEQKIESQERDGDNKRNKEKKSEEEAEVEENRDDEQENQKVSQEANEIKRNSENSLQEDDKNPTQDNNNKEEETNADKSKEKKYHRQGRKSKMVKKHKKTFYKATTRHVK